MKKWFLHTKKADFDEIGAKYYISPIVARILRNRGLTDDKQIRMYLHGTLADCYNASLLTDMERTVEILEEKIRTRKKIRVIGDYDVDGICSTYILVKALQERGAVVDAAIPHRIRDGYGLNESLIEEAAADGIDTILTCDNGIAAISQIALAKELGMTVLVTDHHEIAFTEKDGQRIYELPAADAVVDPKCPTDTNHPENAYPFPGICGAVVAWKLAGLLHPQNSPLIREDFLQIAALATVCDVMELKDENRIIVREGLRLMTNTTQVGLRALLKVTGLWGKEITAYHLGFVLGPCLNATGRLDTASRALGLLQSTSKEEAIRIAQELADLNESRKQMTQEGVENAIGLAEEQLSREGHPDKVLVLYLPQLHESLAGIVAGKIREKYTRPAFILTDGEDSVKGSGRSIDGYDMYAEMTRCRDLFLKYGGHKMAAGLSILPENVTVLRQRLNTNCTLSEEELIDKIYIDVALPFRYADEALMAQLKLLEPWGNGNSKPVFAQKNVQVLESRIVGKNHNVLKLRLRDEAGCVREAVYFDEVQSFAEFLSQNPGQPVSVLYYPSINEYLGSRTIELIITDWC